MNKNIIIATIALAAFGAVSVRSQQSSQTWKPQPVSASIPEHRPDPSVTNHESAIVIFGQSSAAGLGVYAFDRSTGAPLITYGAGPAQVLADFANAGFSHQWNGDTVILFTK